MADSEYPAMFASEERLWWYRGLRGILLRTARALAPPPAAVLDAGCGTGKNAEVLRDAGYRVAAMDLSPAAVAFSASRGSAPTRASVTDIPFAPAAFDLVTCMDVLYMLDPDQRRRALAGIARVLRPGGHAILNTAALPWLSSQHDAAVGEKIRFTAATLRAELAAQPGFEVVRVTYRVFFLFPMVAAVKVAKRLAWREGEEPRSDQDTTPQWLNAPLTAIMAAENAFLRVANAPVGSSVFAVVRKRGAGPR